MLPRLQWILLATRGRNEHRTPKAKIRGKESRRVCGLERGDKGMAGEGASGDLKGALKLTVGPHWAVSRSPVRPQTCYLPAGPVTITPVMCRIPPLPFVINSTCWSVEGTWHPGYWERMVQDRLEGQAP